MVIKILYTSPITLWNLFQKTFDIYELPEVTFPIFFNIIDCYLWKDLILTDKPKCATYKQISFLGGRNNIVNPMTWKDTFLFCKNSKDI